MAQTVNIYIYTYIYVYIYICNVGDRGLVPESGQSPSIFLHGDSWTGEPGGLRSKGSQSRTQLTVPDTFTFATIGEVMVNRLPPKCVLSFRCTWGVVHFQWLFLPRPGEQN